MARNKSKKLYNQNLTNNQYVNRFNTKSITIIQNEAKKVKQLFGFFFSNFTQFVTLLIGAKTAWGILCVL